MEKDAIVISSENETDEEISDEETLENDLPDQKNFENPLAFTKNILEYIDGLPNLASLKNSAAHINNKRIKNIFWASFKKYFAEKSRFERRKIAVKCAYINHYFGSSIPLSENINRFIAPHHFYGIFISEGATIGKGCTIFQHVTIGSNTLLDSKSAGTPVIGDNVYIGAGAKIIGNVKIGNNVRIGAGCTVVRDVPDNCTVAQSEPILIQKTVPQNNRWVRYSDYKKIKARETKLQKNLPAEEHISSSYLLPAPEAQTKYMYRAIDSVTQKKYDDAFKILFCGDLILLEDQVKRAFDGEKYNFDDMFEFTKKYISVADFSIGVLEGPLGGNAKLYSQGNYADGKFFYLNFPDEFADAIKNAGFNFVTTANNHILDMGLAGMQRTIQVLREKNLNFVGSYESAEDKLKSRVKIVEKDGIKMAILAYTYGANRFTFEQLMGEKLSHITSVLPRIDSPAYSKVVESVKKDFELAKSYNPDLIIVLPHWGTQFVDDPNETQKTWRKNFLEFGADIILGDHTHSVQPAVIENFNGRPTFTLYSPGNYANVYRKHDGDASLMAEIYIDRETKKIFGGAVIPMWTRSSLAGNYRPLPIYEILTDEKLRQEISTFDLERISYVLKHITKVSLGTELDEKFIQEHYFFDEKGFQRKKVPPIKIDDSMKRGKFFGSLLIAKDICFVGDSITHGTKNGGVPWYEPLTSFIGGKIFNCSVGSMTIKKLITKEFLEKIVAVPADLFVVAIGTNDVRYRKEKICAMTPEEYISCLQVLRTEILKNNPAAKFIFIAPWTSTDGDKISALKFSAKKQMTAQYSDALKNYCEASGDVFINPNPYIDSVLNSRLCRDYLNDWIHPNATKGVQLYSEAVLRY